MTLGNRIAHHRGRLRLSQLELAEQLGVSRQSVSKWETDASTPELEKLVEMGKIFDITLDELVTGTEVEATAPVSAPPQSGRSTRETVSIVCCICGLMGLLLGLLIPIAWLLAVPLLLVGVYLVQPKAAVQLSWVLLFVPMLFLRQFTGISTWTIFIPNYYTRGLWNLLMACFILWAILLFWTVCAIRLDKTRKWYAIGWGAILVVCPDWLSIPYWAQHAGDISSLPITGWLRIGVSIAVPVAVLVATLRSKKFK